MNISLTGMRWGIRNIFIKYGLRVDEDKMTQMMIFLGFVHVDRWKSSKVGGNTEASQSKKGQAYGPQLVDLQDHKAVDKKIKELVGTEPDLSGENDDFYYSSAGEHGAFGKQKHG